MSKGNKLVITFLCMIVAFLGIAFLFGSTSLASKGIRVAKANISSFFRNSDNDFGLKPGSRQYIQEKDGIKITAELGADQISTKNGKGYLMLTLEAAEIDENDIEKRIPLNLSIVIDKSGSMSGRKLDNVKKAAIEAADLLNKGDRVSIVVYDNDVETIYEELSFNERRFKSAIRNINDGGSTNLEGGVREGIDFVKSNDSDEYINRVILLSDGLANVGVSDPFQLSNIIKELAGEDILVSTIGVGSDYDEKLMTKVASATGGNYYFLKNPRDADDIFIKEFESATQIVAQDIMVEFNMNNNFKIVQGVGYEMKSLESFRPQDMFAGRKSSYLFEIELKNSSDAYGVIDLADIEISFDSTIGSNYRTIQIPARIEITDSEVDSLLSDIVYNEYIESIKADRLWEVYEDLDKVKNDDARSKNSGLLDIMREANGRLQGKFESDITDLEESQKYMEEIKDEDVNQTTEGKTFQKENNYKSFQKKYQR